MRKILLTSILLLTISTPVFATSTINYNNQWIYDRNTKAWTYYINNSKVQGIKTIDNKEYCFDNTGNLGKGWVQKDNNWIYTDKQGIVQHGWKNISGSWYFFNPLGHMEHDTVIEGYTINSNGVWVK